MNIQFLCRIFVNIFKLTTKNSNNLNTFGELYKVTLFGGSHTNILGVVIDGCPPGIFLDIEEMCDFLSRRKSGSPGTTARRESDTPEIFSGIFNNLTTGAPICIAFKNSDAHSADYSFVQSTPRPGHADLTASRKYFGYNDFRGGGMFSGRMTLPLAAAGFIAGKIIPTIKISAEIVSAGGKTDYSEALSAAIKSGDSLGAKIECRCTNIPVGLGNPFFDGIESRISHLVFSVPGIIGIEFGAGFSGADMHGSEFNDAIENTDGKTRTNHSGGINGGISNGNEIIFRVAVKPTPSIRSVQHSINLKSGEIDDFQVPGRHDVCFALRVPAVIESAAAIVLSDFYLMREMEISQHSIINNRK